MADKRAAAGGGGRRLCWLCWRRWRRCADHAPGVPHGLGVGAGGNPLGSKQGPVKLGRLGLPVPAHAVVWHSRIPRCSDRAAAASRLLLGPRRAASGENGPADACAALHGVIGGLQCGGMYLVLGRCLSERRFKQSSPAALLELAGATGPPSMHRSELPSQRPFGLSQIATLAEPGQRCKPAAAHHPRPATLPRLCELGLEQTC